MEKLMRGTNILHFYKTQTDKKKKQKICVQKNFDFIYFLNYFKTY